MAIRQTKLVIKNNSVPSAPFSGATLLKGEAIVNTADGILMFSGVSSSTSEWTPAGPGGNANFFEVGSNLYDLKIRNQITAYSGVTNLSGKFLSGTTNGFVLADISDIAGVDSYVTGATWNPNLLTLNLNNAKPSVNVNINAFSALTISNDLFVSGEITTNDLTITGTGIYNAIANGSNVNEIVNWSSLTAYTSNSDRYVTGGTYDNNTSLITFSGANNFPQFTVDLSSIDVNDTFVTGGTVSYDNAGLDATITLTRNDGNNITITGLTDVKTTGSTLIGSTAYFDTNESLSAYTLDLSGLDVNDTYSTGGTVTQFATNNNNEQIIQITGNDGFTPYNITGLTDTFVTGFTFTPDTLTISQNNGVDLTANINNYYVTGGTVSYIGPDGTITLTRNDNINVTITGITDIYTTGATLVGSTAYFNTNDSLSAYTLDLTSFVPTGDTFVTGFTYTPISNTFTISQDGGPTLTAQINSVSGLSISNLTAGRVVYVGTGGLLTDESGFEYNDGTNLLTVGNINVQNASGTTANIGQGGLVIGSGGSLSTPGIGDLTIHGNLTVFGTETIVATSELYVEDPQITLNYNPTGSTISTSVSSGIMIQDGNGIISGDTYFTIGQMQNLTSGNTSEYTGLTGYVNRGWVTQLNDIVIRNTNLNEGAPDGVRVLAEFDVLDGGSY